MPQNKRQLYKEQIPPQKSKSPVLFFLISSYARYLHVIYNLCWLAVKVSPKGK